jgi:hypothetical protein
MHLTDRILVRMRNGRQLRSVKVEFPQVSKTRAECVGIGPELALTNQAMEDLP